MQTKFNANGTTVDVFNINPDQITDTLIPRIYEVSFNKMRGYYLTIIADSFIIDGKVYGNTYERVDKILSTYDDRSSNTGVILSGHKGTGKSLLSQVLSNTCINKGMPVILIQEPYEGSDFISFINSLGACLFIFDEFTKTYQIEGNSVQNRLLTLFDGATSKVTNNKSIFLVIDNDKRYFDEFMLDRTGRFFYHFEYGKLTEEVITKYCLEQDIKQSIIDDIIDIANKRTKFGYDLLKSIVEEYKRYPNETIETLVTDMNIDISNSIMYKIISIKDKNNDNKTLNISSKVPLKDRVNGYVSNYVEDGIPDDTDDWLEHHDLVYSKGNYQVFETNNYILMFEVIMNNVPDYRDLF